MTTPTTTQPDVSSTPSIPTTKSKQPGWKFWYVLILSGLTAFALQDEPSAIPYGIPLNLIIFFIPTWLVVRLVRWTRRK